MVLLAAIHLFSHLVNDFKDGREISGTVQVDTVDSVLVDVHHTSNTVNFRIEDVSIQSKTVVGNIFVGRDLRAKAEDRNLLVSIIVLQDTSHRVDGFQIFIFIHVKVMK